MIIILLARLHIIPSQLHGHESIPYSTRLDYPHDWKYRRLDYYNHYNHYNHYNYYNYYYNYHYNHYNYFNNNNNNHYNCLNCLNCLNYLNNTILFIILITY